MIIILILLLLLIIIITWIINTLFKETKGLGKPSLPSGPLHQTFTQYALDNIKYWQLIKGNFINHQNKMGRETITILSFSLTRYYVYLI